MNLKTIHIDLAYKWIKIIGINNYLKSALHDFAGENVFGYVYIDHDAGVTVEIVKIFDNNNGEIIHRESPSDQNIRIICRIENILGSSEVDTLSEEEIINNGLKIPESIAIYQRNDLSEFRKEADYHNFRGGGFPDDIQILLFPKGNLNPELIWGRVEKYENKIVTCQLLNKPHQKLGLKINDSIAASIQLFNGEKYVVFEIEQEVRQRKKWWKFN